MWISPSVSFSQTSWLEEFYQKRYTGLINDLVGFTKWHSYKNKPNFCHLELRKNRILNHNYFCQGAQLRLFVPTLPF